jgi:hypothetical protein
MEVKDGIGDTTHLIDLFPSVCLRGSATEKANNYRQSQARLGFPQAQGVRFLTFSGISTLQTLG